MNGTQPLNDAERAVYGYGDMLYRLAIGMLRNPADAEDAVQDTLLSYIRKAPVFNTGEHERAWLLRVCMNKCRDELRRRKHRPTSPETDAGDAGMPDTGIMDALQALPEHFRAVMLLHYSEGYSVDEIAKIIRRTPSAVKMRLKKGRELLEDEYRKEHF